MKRVLLAVALVFGLATFVGCSGDSTKSGTKDTKTPPTQKLDGSKTPADGSKDKVTEKKSDEKKPEEKKSDEKKPDEKKPEEKKPEEKK